MILNQVDCALKRVDCVLKWVVRQWLSCLNTAQLMLCLALPLSLSAMLLKHVPGILILLVPEILILVVPEILILLVPEICLILVVAYKGCWCGLWLLIPQILMQMHARVGALTPTTVALTL